MGTGNMMESASEFIARVMADNRAALYRCRWSEEDARRVVPRLTRILSDADPAVVDEALRALFTIGTPAVAAAGDVAPLIDSEHPITRQLATLALGQIAHKKPDLCVGPVTAALDHDECRHDALRILKFLGHAARSSIVKVASYYDRPDAKTRRLAAVAAIAIDSGSGVTQQLVTRAASDRSKAVRTAVQKAMKAAQQAAAHGPGTTRAAPSQ